MVVVHSWAGDRSCAAASWRLGGSGGRQRRGAATSARREGLSWRLVAASAAAAAPAGRRGLRRGRRTAAWQRPGGGAHLDRLRGPVLGVVGAQVPQRLAVLVHQHRQPRACWGVGVSGCGCGCACALVNGWVGGSAGRQRWRAPRCAGKRCLRRCRCGTAAQARHGCWQAGAGSGGGTGAGLQAGGAQHGARSEAHVGCSTGLQPQLPSA